MKFFVTVTPLADSGEPKGTPEADESEGRVTLLAPKDLLDIAWADVDAPEIPLTPAQSAQIIVDPSLSSDAVVDLGDLVNVRRDNLPPLITRPGAPGRETNDECPPTSRCSAT